MQNVANQKFRADQFENLWNDSKRLSPKFKVYHRAETCLRKYMAVGLPAQNNKANEEKSQQEIKQIYSNLERSQNMH